jgi:hypothetical protein
MLFRRDQNATRPNIQIIEGAINVTCEHATKKHTTKEYVTKDHGTVYASFHKEPLMLRVIVLNVRPTHTHTHTHTYIYIHICTHIYVCINNINVLGSPEVNVTNIFLTHHCFCIIKLITDVFTRVFVPGKLFQPSLMFVGMARSQP